MAIKQYIQAGSDEGFYFFDDGNYALIINEYGADILAKTGRVYTNGELVFFDTDTCLISEDGYVYLPIGKQTTPSSPKYLLLEDGGYILLESGGKILLQRQ